MSSEPHPIRVCLVLHPDNRSWIIEKIALRLAEYLPEFGVEAVIAPEPRSDVDINHWMSYAFANQRLATPATMFVTHLDDPYKVALVKKELKEYVDLGICMSSQAVADLVGSGISPDRLCCVSPAHDDAVKPRRIKIGITTKLYSDGRKREVLLAKLAAAMMLDAFCFEIFGSGWENVIARLRLAGATVQHFPGGADYAADYKTIIDHVPTFDYYLYLGMDEGSLGTLDALAAGVRTIVTPQGFHLDIPNGITYSVSNFDDVLEVFMKLSKDWNERVSSVRHLTWKNYAHHHSTIWGALLNGTQATLAKELNERANPLFPEAAGARGMSFKLRRLSPRRSLSAASHLPLLRPLRSWFKSLRQ